MTDNFGPEPGRGGPSGAPVGAVHDFMTRRAPAADDVDDSEDEETAAALAAAAEARARRRAEGKG